MTNVAVIAVFIKRIINKVKTQKPGNIVNLVACDTRFYKNYFEGKSVKVNVTLLLYFVKTETRVFAY